MTSIRIPSRVVLWALDASGWGQRAEPVSDEPRLRLLAMMDGQDGRRYADGSYRLDDPSEGVLFRLWFEAEHLADSYRYGDHTPDALADYNASRAMQRRVEEVLGRSVRYDEVRTAIAAAE